MHGGILELANTERGKRETEKEGGEARERQRETEKEGGREE